MTDGATPVDLAQITDSLVKGILHSHRMSHTGVVTAAAAILDDSLKEAIQTKLPGLNKKLSERLFDDFGPLGSFAAKISMAHALDITSASVHTELEKIRKIRNEFSHSIKILSLDVEPIRPLFDALVRPAGAKGNYAEVFMACISAIHDYLEKFLIRMGLERS